MTEFDDRSAPWNESDPIPVTFQKKVSLILSKEMGLQTTQYEDHVDCDGHYYSTESDDTDWKSEFYNQHRNIPELLEILADEAKKHINLLVEMCQREGARTEYKVKLARWRQILDDCSGWKMEEFEIDDI